MVPSQIHFCCAMTGLLEFFFLITIFIFPIMVDLQCSVFFFLIVISLVYFFLPLFLFIFDFTFGMWKFWGQGSNPSHSSNLRGSSDNARSLACWATGELPDYFSFYLISIFCSKSPFSCHISLLRLFLAVAVSQTFLVLMTLTVLRSIGQVYCGRPHY